MGLCLGFAILVSISVLTNNVGPTSNGMNVAQWVNSTQTELGFLMDSNGAAVVEGFGKAGIPFFIKEFHRALSERGGKTNWLSGQLAKLGWVSLRPETRRAKALGALAVLGRHHPEEIDPFFTGLLSTTNRAESISMMGYMGSRHFHFLTNLIASPNRKDSEDAIWGLVGMGTNAEAAVPLILSCITNYQNRGRRWWFSLYALKQIGGDHEATLPTLLSLLESSNRDAHSMIPRILSQMTNHFDKIGPEFVRLGQAPITATNDPGEFVSCYLFRVGVASDVGVPILIQRLVHAIAQDGHVPGPNSQMVSSLRYLAQYGSDAGEAIPLIENEVLLHLPIVTDRSAPIWLTRRNIEISLRKIDPRWKRPVVPK